MIHFRGGRKSIDINSYPDMDEFFQDLSVAYREEIDHLYQAGLRYLNWTIPIWPISATPK